MYTCTNAEISRWAESKAVRVFDSAQEMLIINENDVFYGIYKITQWISQVVQTMNNHLNIEPKCQRFSTQNANILILGSLMGISSRTVLDSCFAFFVAFIWNVFIKNAAVRTKLICNKLNRNGVKWREFTRSMHNVQTEDEMATSHIPYDWIYTHTNSGFRADNSDDNKFFSSSSTNSGCISRTYNEHQMNCSEKISTIWNCVHVPGRCSCDKTRLASRLRIFFIRFGDGCVCLLDFFLQCIRLVRRINYPDLFSWHCISVRFFSLLFFNFFFILHHAFRFKHASWVAIDNIIGVLTSNVSVAFLAIQQRISSNRLCSELPSSVTNKFTKRWISFL